MAVRMRLIMVFTVNPSPKNTFVNTVNTTIPTAKANNLPGQTWPCKAWNARFVASISR